uniref:Ku70/Ku80 C-terminal arm domain-containing protein n=1 Tax=Aotus nancymaae TaxID=37293 RepID=A0A2K5D3W4_AOTNA
MSGWESYDKTEDDKEVAALCRYTPWRNIPPYFVALVPQDEELDDQKIQVTPPGRCPLLKKIMDKIKAIVEKLHFTYRSNSFENPVLQQHFRNLEALALASLEPEQAVDLTLPKVEAMNKRLGSLVDEFKELVYPPDYNPEGKVTKRKHDNEGSGSKSPKLEYSEEELKTHIRKGMLGNFTVPMLKEACRAHGLKSGLKKGKINKHLQDSETNALKGVFQKCCRRTDIPATWGLEKLPQERHSEVNFEVEKKPDMVLKGIRPFK